MCHLPVITKTGTHVLAVSFPEEEEEEEEEEEQDERCMFKENKLDSYSKIIYRYTCFM